MTHERHRHDDRCEAPSPADLGGRASRRGMARTGVASSAPRHPADRARHRRGHGRLPPVAGPGDHHARQRGPGNPPAGPRGMVPGVVHPGGRRPVEPRPRRPSGRGRPDHGAGRRHHPRLRRAAPGAHAHPRRRHAHATGLRGHRARRRSPRVARRHLRRARHRVPHAGGSHGRHRRPAERRAADPGGRLLRRARRRPGGRPRSHRAHPGPLRRPGGGAGSDPARLLQHRLLRACAARWRLRHRAQPVRSRHGCRPQPLGVGHVDRRRRRAAQRGGRVGRRDRGVRARPRHGHDDSTAPARLAQHPAQRGAGPRTSRR